MKHAVQVTILGQQFSLKSEASPDEVAMVVDLVNGKISEVVASSRITDSLNVAVLALLNLAGSFLRLQEELAQANARPNFDPQAESKLMRLLERLESSCPEMQ